MKQKISPLKIKDKRGVLGLETVKQVMVTFLVIGVIAVVIIVALVSLRDAGIFTSGSRDENLSTAIVENITAGTAGFFSNTDTIFQILVVVVIIMAVAIIVLVVSRFGGGTRAAGV